MTIEEATELGLTIITRRTLRYVYIKCCECGKSMCRRLHILNNIDNKYCSQGCRHKNGYITTQCAICSKAMNIPKSWYSINKTCSFKCRGILKSRRYRKYFQCINCRKESYYVQSYKKYCHSADKFCSKVCRLIYYESHPESHPKFKNGKTVSGKYVKLNKFNIQEHRYVMESIIGRKLSKGEVVHHIDGNGANNSIDNLLLMTKTEHHKLHYRERKIDINGRFLPINGGKHEDLYQSRL